MSSHYRFLCEEELERIVEQMIRLYQPKSLILFGSLEKGAVRENSDIDLCVVVDTPNKRKLASDMYIHVESRVAFDLVVYTEEEWQRNIQNKASFAHQIWKEGRLLSDSAREGRNRMHSHCPVSAVQGHG